MGKCPFRVYSTVFAMDAVWTEGSGHISKSSEKGFYQEMHGDLIHLLEHRE
jgi:hypothetical protein